MFKVRRVKPPPVRIEDSDWRRFEEERAVV
jgi:hypothetical protein